MLAQTIVLAFLTGGSITGPMEFDGVGVVWRYEGKANFASQQDAAMESLREHCGQQKRRPVIVSIDAGRQGIVRFGNNYVGNKSQVIFFKCK